MAGSVQLSVGKRQGSLFTPPLQDTHTHKPTHDVVQIRTPRSILCAESAAAPNCAVHCYSLLTAQQQQQVDDIHMNSLLPTSAQQSCNCARNMQNTNRTTLLEALRWAYTQHIVHILAATQLSLNSPSHKHPLVRSRLQPHLINTHCDNKSCRKCAVPLLLMLLLLAPHRSIHSSLPPPPLHHHHHHHITAANYEPTWSTRQGCCGRTAIQLLLLLLDQLPQQLPTSNSSKTRVSLCRRLLLLLLCVLLLWSLQTGPMTRCLG